ncbi:GNAT family N-acetyltransferase [Streptomyces niveus]|uniref:GNAT family N-acetyltransferase n=1 Tax=Streptomyces niveus TaxID=193462 RepID=UPI0036EE80F0
MRSCRRAVNQDPNTAPMRPKPAPMATDKMFTTPAPPDTQLTAGYRSPSSTQLDGCPFESEPGELHRETSKTGTDALGLNLDRYTGFDDYLAHGLKAKRRQNLTRDLRAADRAGVTGRTTDTDNADPDGFVRLARSTAAQFGDSDYYRPGPLPGIRPGTRRLRPSRRTPPRKPTDCLRTHPHRRHRTHYWAVGYAQKDTPHFSPFYVAYAHVMRAAWASGRDWVELGRRNPTFKRRYGLQPPHPARLLQRGAPAPGRAPRRDTHLNNTLLSRQTPPPAGDGLRQDHSDP